VHVGVWNRIFSVFLSFSLSLFLSLLFPLFLTVCLWSAFAAWCCGRSPENSTAWLNAKADHLMVYDDTEVNVRSDANLKDALFVVPVKL
jgi:hypothetical protein